MQTKKKNRVNETKWKDNNFTAKKTRSHHKIYKTVLFRKQKKHEEKNKQKWQCNVCYQKIFKPNLFLVHNFLIFRLTIDRYSYYFYGWLHSNKANAILSFLVLFFLSEDMSSCLPSHLLWFNMTYACASYFSIVTLVFRWRQMTWIYGFDPLGHAIELKIIQSYFAREWWTVDHSKLCKKNCFKSTKKLMINERNPKKKTSKQNKIRNFFWWYILCFCFIILISMYEIFPFSFNTYCVTLNQCQIERERERRKKDDEWIKDKP